MENTQSTTVKAPRVTKKQAEQNEAIAKLRGLIKAGTVVYTTLRHVSASGMSRDISLHIVNSDGEIESITWYAAKAMGDKVRESGGHHAIRANGCGMDMGYSLVYHLSRVLFPDGFVPSEAGRSGRNGTPATARDSDGGYALVHRWV